MTTRNLTDSFIFMRNNSIQNRQYCSDYNNSDKTALLVKRPNNFDSELGSRDDIPIEYNNISNAIQRDFVNVQQKMKVLISLHDRHLNRACLDDNLEEDRDIEAQTKVLTEAFIEVHRKLSQLVSSGRHLRLAGGCRAAMSANIQANHARTLQDLSVAFRKAQSQYLTKLKCRDERLKGFFEIPDDPSIGGGDFEEDSDGLAPGYHHRQQLQQDGPGLGAITDDNTRVVAEREKEINEICRSIQELNEIFRDIGRMVTVQGSVVDRIDHNIEQTQFKVREGLGQLQKAHKLQKKNRKMLIIVALAVIASILSLVFIVTKLV